jgi:hypothetical protein
MAGAVNLSSYQFAQLRFWARWSVEPTWDFATVELSTNGGSSWNILRTELSHRGSGRTGGQQPAGSFGFDSYTPGLEWTEQTADLTPYAGRQIKVRFRLASDGGDQRDGLYMDDIRIIAYTTTPPPPPPPPPLPVFPADGAAFLPLSVQLRWAVTSGASGYQLQMSSDSLFATLLVNDSTLADTSRMLTDLAGGTAYHWRVRAWNTGGPGPFSPLRRFSTAPTVTRTCTIQALWNLISVPLEVSDPRAASLFPGAASPVYRFSGTAGYLPCDTLASGVGYWVKFDSAASVVIVGRQSSPDTIPVRTGWNMIGTISEPVDSASLVQLPPGILESPFYEYGAGYLPVVVLQPGRGYWVKAGQDGSLVFSIPAAWLRGGSAGEVVNKRLEKER